MAVRDLAISAPLPTSAAARGWLLGQLTLLAVGALVLVWVFEVSDLDRQIAERFFDRGLGVFPLRKTWFFEAVMHVGAKQVTYVLVAACLYVCWLGWTGRLAWLPPRNALLAAVGMVAIPAATSLLKLLTNRHCPWDIVDFGGYAPFQHLFEAAPRGIKAGQCFPSGHASTGFLWLVWAVALRPAGIGAARLALCAGLLVGGLLGAARMAQGAHFLSHTLWTLWLAWALSVTLAVVFRADLRPGRAPAGIKSMLRIEP